MRSRCIHTLVAACALAVTTFAATTASADWGEGIKGGPFVVHPGLSLSAGFDSNLYYSSHRDDEPIFQAPEGLVEPRIGIETDEPGDWDLSGQAAVGWRQYFSESERVRNQSGLTANLTGDVAWNTQGPFSLQLSEEFVRTNETPNSPTANTINRIFNQAGIMAGLHPGGRILETYASYDYALYRHSEQVRGLDRDSHQFGWHAHWSFLPKTALVAEVDHRRIRYLEEFRGRGTVSPDGQLQNIDSNPFRVMGGIEGLLTERISLGARGGYGWARYVEGPTHQGAIGQVNASYQFGSIARDNRLRAGYERDFSDSPIGNYYTSHRVLAGYEQGLLDNRLRLELEVDGQVREYAEIGLDETETQAREITYPEDLSDLLVGVSASADYEVRKGWNLGLRYRLRSNFTDDTIEIEGPAIPGEQAVRDYRRHHLLLSTELTY